MKVKRLSSKLNAKAYRETKETKKKRKVNKKVYMNTGKIYSGLFFRQIRYTLFGFLVKKTKKSDFPMYFLKQQEVSFVANG